MILKTFASKLGIDYAKITKKDWIDLKHQYLKIVSIELLLPKTHASSLFFQNLIIEFETESRIAGKTSKYSLIDIYIANEILQDLKEVIVSYKSYMGYKEIDYDTLKDKGGEDWSIHDYDSIFEKTCMMKDNFSNTDDFGISAETIFDHILAIL